MMDYYGRHNRKKGGGLRLKTTTNMNLKKPEYGEPIDIGDINENMDIIDKHTHKVATATTSGYINSANYKRINWLISKNVANYGGTQMSGESYGRILRLSETIYDASDSVDKYFIGVGSSGKVYRGVGLNGADVAWKEIALSDKVASYETGVWTPSPCYTASGLQNPSLTGSGTYVKVGRIVYITGWCYNSDSPSTAFSLFAITNLPFVPSTMAYGLTARNIVVTDSTNDFITPTTLKFGTYYSNGMLNLRGMTGSNTSATWFFDGYYYV